MNKYWIVGIVCNGLPILHSPFIWNCLFCLTSHKEASISVFIKNSGKGGYETWPNHEKVRNITTKKDVKGHHMTGFCRTWVLFKPRGYGGTGQCHPGIGIERVTLIRVFKKWCTVPDKQVLISWNPPQCKIKKICTAAFLHSIWNK